MKVSTTATLSFLMTAVTPSHVTGEGLRRQLQRGGGGQRPNRSGRNRRPGNEGGGNGGNGNDGNNIGDGEDSGGNNSNFTNNNNTDDHTCPARASLEMDTLQFRFSKSLSQAMTREDYPVNSSNFDWLSLEGLISVREEQLNCPECYTPLCRLVDAVGGHPWHPTEDLNSPFWTDFDAVVQWQELRRSNGEDAIDTYMPTPDTWKDTFTTVDQAAAAVHDEYPGSHHEPLIMDLLGRGMTLDRNILPNLSDVEFLRGIVALSDLNTWAFGAVGPVNFAVKYFVGRARPEEVAYAIFNGEMTAPNSIKQALEDMALTSAESFTAYPEGSPRHPSWPAMHSASSVSSTWLAAVTDLMDKPELWCQAMLTDYAVAQARTVAGVHYPSDNIAGLKLGQQILLDLMPAHVEEMYGSRASDVSAKLRRVVDALDWDTFEDSACFESGFGSFPSSQDAQT